MAWPSFFLFCSLGCTACCSGTVQTEALEPLFDFALEGGDEHLSLLQINADGGSVHAQVARNADAWMASIKTVADNSSELLSQNSSVAPTTIVSSADHFASALDLFLSHSHTMEVDAVTQFEDELDLKESFRGVWFIVGFGVGALCCGLLPLAMHFYTRSISRAIENASERCGSSELGVEVDLGQVSVHLAEGYVDMHGLTIFNPPGYSSEHLLKVKRVRARIHVSTLLCSNFRNIIIDSLAFKGVDVVYDKSWKSSNVNDVLSWDSSPMLHEATKRSKNTSMGRFADIEDHGAAAKTLLTQRPPADPATDTRVTLRTVLLEDVGVRMAQEMLRGAGLRTLLDRIGYEDFSDEVGVDIPAHVAAQGLLRSVLRKVRSTIAAKRTAERKH